MADTTTMTFTVTGEPTIHCAGCEQRIGNALRRVPGAEAVQASARTQQVQVTIDLSQTTPEQVQAKLEHLGYHVSRRE